jgi:ElaB/YqjD/DUF883 family membrane-anchored ribosome-binding protein
VIGSFEGRHDERAQHARKELARTVLEAGPMNQEQMTEGGTSSSEEFENEVVAWAERARETIEEFVHEQPHAALGLAAAAGFILGGGLTPRRLIRLGLAAGGPALSRQLIDQVVRVASEAIESDSSGAKRPTPRRHRPAKNED